MSNTDICTCDYFPHCQDVICMTCGKSQKQAGEVLRQLMAENERMKIALRRVARYVSVPEPRREAGPHEQILRQRLETAVGICRDVLTEVEP